MIQDINTSLGKFDITEKERDFIKNAEYDDYDLLVLPCDALALPTGFCILEQRFVDAAIRYGNTAQPLTVGKRCWK